MRQAVRPQATSLRDPVVSPERRVLLVEEHALVAEGLNRSLTAMGYSVETCDGPTSDDVLDHVRRFRPGCVLTDVRFHNAIGSGIMLVEPLVAAGTRVVMLTAERRRSVLASCLEAGAAGWIARSASLDDVDDALRRVFAGEPLIGKTTRAILLDELRAQRSRRADERAVFDRLTHREALVLAALCDGLIADEIAREHFVELTTVRSQIRSVLRKLEVRSQLAAVAIAGAHRHLLPERGCGGRDRRRSAVLHPEGVGRSEAKIA